MAAAEPALLRSRPAPGVELLTLNRPRILNALSGALLRELIAVVRELGGRDDVGALVLTGAGRAFSAGGDLNELRAADRAQQESYFGLYGELALALRALRQPAIAALNGLTFAGGLELACMCELRVADREAVLCVSDAPHGLAPTGGLTWLLPRLVGTGRARWMALSDARMRAAEAHAYGLVDEIAAEAGGAVEQAVALAARLAAYPGVGVEVARAAFDEGERGTLEDAIAREIELNLRAMEHPDVRRAFDDFLD